MTGTSQSRALAAVFHGPRRPLELSEFELPELRAGEVLVEITCSTICGSDLHTIRGDRPVSGPTVLGHEIIGRITQLPADGPPVTDVMGDRLAIGDRVTWAVAASCGTCFFCEHELPQKCDKLFKYGHETVERGALSGGLAEFCHLAPGTAIVKVPKTLSDRVACPANCATATVAGALRIARGCADKSVVIHGAGMLGLTTAAMAATQGATSITVTDLSEQRLVRAMDFGATHTVHIGEDPAVLSNAIRDVTDGRGADVAFEMSGSPTAIEESVDLLRIGGQLVLVGSVFPTRATQLFPEQIIRKLLRIDGVHNYTPIDLTVAIEFLSTATTQYPFESLVGAELTLRELNTAIEGILDADHIRIAVRPR
ncbi:MAG: zinc-binding dehydrogenase [Planctomycetes bacterium]|nr:zinc-binding dehydrogenase [Planctomycetota bacterium]